MSPLLRLGWRAAAFSGVLVAISFLRAQETNAPSDVTPTAPEMGPSTLTTNAAPASPSDQPGLSLRSSPVTETTNSEVAPSMPVINPEPSSTGQEGVADDMANHLLVVYNSNDPDSKVLADYYASQRNIPPERVLPIACSTKEEITRAEYEKTIREPIFYYILQKNWMERQNGQINVGTRTLRLLQATRNNIWAMVLMRGVPLKIAPDPSDDDSVEIDAHFQTNAAAVDSELALLPIFGFPKGGYVPNSFFDKDGTGLQVAGPKAACNLIFVTRLDAPTPQQVRRMIDDTLYAEKNRLAGLAVIDSCGITDPQAARFSGDLWLRNAAILLARDGWAVKFDDKPDVLPSTDPCNQVALYLGWYAGQATGPWILSPNRFVRGAIAYHLHSYSANTLRSETDNWVGPLIAHGAAATMGTVYEPYLALTPHEDIFTKRLLAGDYFAEAAYASIPGLSWMVTVVGDPLYRPFRVPLESALADAGATHTSHDDWLLLQSVRRQIVARQIEMKTESLQAALEVPGAGPVAEEGLGDLLERLNDSPAVDQAYKKAMDNYTMPIDRIRSGLKLAQYYANHKESARAQSQVAALLQLFPVDAPRFGLAAKPIPIPAGTLPPPIDDSPPMVASPPEEKPSVTEAPTPVDKTTPNPVELPKPPKPPLPPFPQPVPNEK